MIVVIPDLMDAGDEDLTTAIAAAPNIRPSNIMQSISDLENDIAESESMFNQV